MNNIHEKIIVYQSYKFYNKFYSLICRWCDIEDIIQYCYESILKRKLWECDNKRILTTVINRSCVEFLRKNVVGFRQYDIKFDNTSVSIDDNFWLLDDLLFIDNNNDDEDNINIKISISQLSKFLTDKQKYILWLFINGYTKEEISKKIKVTASRISQIIIIIENKLYEIVNYNKIPDKLYTGDFCKFHPNKKSI